MLSTFALTLLIVVAIALSLSVRIVPQSLVFVVERFGRFQRVLTPGVNFILPGADRVSHRVSVLERQNPDSTIEAITRDNSTIKITTSTFFRITDAELSVYRIADVERAINTTVIGIVRSLVGSVEFDEVQSNRDDVSQKLLAALAEVARGWGVEITRCEIIDVSVDDATRRAMLVQITAERERRAAVTTAEGQKRAAELAADAELYTAQKIAEARRVEADAEAYATTVVAAALQDDGMTAAGFEIAKNQIRAITEMGKSESSKVILVPAEMGSVFSNTTGFASIFADLLGKGPDKPKIAAE
jgi:regulator of protease activity HflC (stomatin/prohibitin superfamily)